MSKPDSRTSSAAATGSSGRRAPRRRRGVASGSRAPKSLDLEKLWAWLPTFRVVAEYESVGEAARLLKLSASSVSRSVRLLEQELGKPLFARMNGRLLLNDAGRLFLEAVRRSMRLVDDGVDGVRQREGSFRLSVPRALLAEAVTAIRHLHVVSIPDASPVILRDSGSPREVAAGILDLLVVVDDLPAESLEVHRLGAVQVGAFVAPDHDLARQQLRGFAAAASHAWVTAPLEFPDRTRWPCDVSRNVGLEVTDCLGAHDACLRGLGPALLPRSLATTDVEEGRLLEVPELDFEPVPIFALRRPQLAADRAETIINSFRKIFLEGAATG